MEYDVDSDVGVWLRWFKQVESDPTNLFLRARQPSARGDLHAGRDQRSKEPRTDKARRAGDEGATHRQLVNHPFVAR